MLSARAGEESRVEGMEAGADDYLVKPFGARELLARVTAHLQMARMRREASESLRQGEERLRLALTAARMVAWQWDPVEDKVTFSDNVAEVFGLLPGSVPENRSQGFALIHPDDVRQHREKVLRAVKECSSYQSQFRMIRQDNQAMLWLEERGYCVADEAGKAVRLVGVITDITDRKRAEQELADAHQFLHSCIDALSSHIAVLDENGVILTVNDPWRRFADENHYGGDNYGVGSNYVEECVPPSGECVEGALVAAGLTDVLQGKKSYFELEYPCHAPNEERWFIMRVTRFKSPGPVRVVVSHENVTKRKKAEQALQDAGRRKDEFLAMLAHELRNPLAPLRNGLQVMKLARGDSKAMEQAWAMMDRQLTQMVRLIDDLMDVSRISRGKVELRKARIALAKVLQQAAEISRPLIEASGHTFSLEVPSEPIFVDADATRLTQVFSNLLNNAAKYTERGGRIALRMQRQGSEVVVRVRDTGVGIPAPMLPRVFDLFTQVEGSLEKAQGGLGIGLTLVKRLTEMHGGSVEAFSEGHGKGSEFVVRLPVALALAGEQQGDQATAVGPVARRRILVVDDNRDAALSLAMVLKIQGNETQTAHDGLEALAVAAAFRPDVILLDIGMPKLNGYDAARRIRQEPWGKNVVLVAVTGWAQEDDRRRSQEAGFDFHMVKPVEPAALEKFLAELKSETA
jgi:PAS domain S-box-containing protein